MFIKKALQELVSMDSETAAISKHVAWLSASHMS